jgi:hypothetical protein
MLLLQHQKSCIEKQNPKTEQPEQLENPAIEQQIISSLDAVLDLGVIKVYDESGKFIFSDTH